MAKKLTDKQVKRKAKKGKKPLTKAEQIRYNQSKKEASDKRIQKREDTRGKRRAKAGKTPTQPKSKPVVTSDNRKEVSKGSKASGVSVNGKPVRRGRVKAAEKATAKGKRSAVAKAAGKVAKTAAKRAGPIGAALTVADAAISAEKRARAKAKAQGSKPNRRKKK